MIGCPQNRRGGGLFSTLPVDSTLALLGRYLNLLVERSLATENLAVPDMSASHFNDGFRALYDPSLYQEVASGRRTGIRTCGFIAALVFFASLIAVGFFSIRLTPALTNFNFYDFGKELQGKYHVGDARGISNDFVAEVYPEGLEITITPQLSDHDVTEELPPKITLNKRALPLITFSFLLPI